MVSWNTSGSRVRAFFTRAGRTQTTPSCMKMARSRTVPWRSVKSRGMCMPRASPRHRSRPPWDCRLVPTNCCSRPGPSRLGFDRAFWCQDLGTYALALDGSKQQCRVRSSNAGQCLFSGIVPSERAEALAQTLMDVESFSGWGIRTLAATERRFNPMGYHTGAVWPHDNALIGKGLAMYGLRREPSQLFQALVQSQPALRFAARPRAVLWVSTKAGGTTRSLPGRMRATSMGIGIRASAPASVPRRPNPWWRVTDCV